jgi:D-amino-acid dehydrogenase
LRAARDDIERRRRHGVRAEWLDGAALRERVPELGDHVAGGLYFEDAHVCSDPAALLDALARDVEADGGLFRPRRVSAMLPVDEGIEVIADGEAERFDRVVVAAGARSRSLARLLGDDFPLDTERGYHVMLNGQRGPSLPVMSGEYKFVTTPMTAGTRLAGTSELGGLERLPDSRRYALLRRQAARLFPGLDTSDGTEWMGYRPTLPDSLPSSAPRRGCRPSGTHWATSTSASPWPASPPGSSPTPSPAASRPSTCTRCVSSASEKRCREKRNHR